MVNDSSDFELICPKCGTLYGGNASGCPKCGHARASAPPAYRPPRKAKPSRGPILPDFSILVKTALILLAIAIPAWLLYQFTNYLSDSVKEANLHPTDPMVTTTDFFESLEQEDYQKCYALLVKERKMAAAIGKHTRDRYFQHFTRIRDYLAERVDEEFTWDMAVSTDGRQVQFGANIALTLSMVGTKGLDKLSHYAIKEVKEFPQDIAPGIGMEKYQRHLNRVIESIDELAQDEKDMDPADILEPRAGERDSERRDRWLNSFKRQRQLDTRHVLLEWIVRQFSQDRQVQAFLAEVAQDENEVVQLRRLARANLND